MSELPVPAVIEEARPALPPLRRRLGRTALSLLLVFGVAALIAAWNGVRPADVSAYVARVLGYITHVAPWIVAFCVASAYAELGFQALRWYLVMQPLLGLRYGQAYRAQVVGQMFNALLPARGGDLLRVQYLGRRTGKSRAVILGTEVVDRWLDYWGPIPVLLIAALTGGLPRWAYLGGGIFVAAMAGLGTLMLILAQRGWRPRPGTRLGEAWGAFSTGARAFRSRRTLGIAIAVAPLPWLWEVFALMIATRGFGIDLSFAQAFSLMVGFNVAMVVPSPGGIGPMEAGGTAALMAFGVAKDRALAFMIVYRLTQLLPSIVAGIGILLVEGEQMFGGAPQPAPERAAPPVNEPQA